MKVKRVILAIGIIILAAVISCNKESPVVVPADVTFTPPGTPPGDNTPRLVEVFPANLSTDIPVNTDIILVFSEPVNLATIIPANVSVTGVTAYTASTVTDGRTVIINITTPANLPYNTLHTIQVTTNVTDTGGTALGSSYTTSFTTAVDDTALAYPCVIAASRVPAAGAAGVSIDQSYVEVTFSRDMNSGTIGLASFTIAPAAGINVTQPDITNFKTYRLNLSTLDYIDIVPNYTVTLDTGTIRDASGNFLVADGNQTWSFSTESDPDTGPGTYAISSVWVNDVAAGTATVRFVTSYPIAAGNNITVYYGTDTNYGSSSAPVNGNGNSIHSVTITPGTAGTKYYFRVAIPAYTINQTVDPQNPTVSLSFISGGPSTTNPVNTAITNNNNVKTEITLHQSADLTITPAYNGSSYLIWKEGTSHYGRFITAAGALSANWPSGTQIDTNNRSNVRIFSDGLGGVIATMEDGAGFYTKRFHDNAGIEFYTNWAANAGATGLSFGHTAGYTNPWAQTVYSGTIANNVYPGFVTKITPAPGTTTPLTTEMQDVGTNQLIFDYNVDFSSIAAFTTGDYILTDDQINYNSNTFTADTATLTRPNYANYFRYTMIEDADYSSIGDYYIILDSGVGYTADDGTNGATIGTTIYTLNDMSIFFNGDIIENDDASADDGKYTYITNIELDTPIAGVDRITIADDIGLVDIENFIVHQRLEGQIAGSYGTQRTIQNYTFPLWDNNAIPNFSSVNANDWVLNETTGSVNAAQVTTVLSTNRLELSANIMNGNRDYWIVRLANAAEPIVAFGKRDNFGTTNQLRDTDAHYGIITNATNGDLVFNVRRNRYAVIRSGGGTNTLTLTRDIVSLATDTDAYMIFNSNEPLVDAGRCTSAGTNQVNDTNASFSSSVSVGDLVYNYNGAFIGIVTNVNSNILLTITGNTVIDQYYFIVGSRYRIMFAWQNGADILGALINNDSGTTYSTFNICTAAAIQQNVRLVSNSTGGAFAVYESGGSIYGKSIDGTGTVSGGAAVIGTAIGTGTILNVKSDNNNGLYLLYNNGTNILLTRATPGPVWTQTITANSNDVVMTVDSSSNVIVAYSDANNDIYAQKRILGTGNDNFGNALICPLDSYVSGLSVVSDQNNGAIISWNDSRYYAQIGYSVFAQAVNTTGVQQWDADAAALTDLNGIRIGTTSTYDPADLALWSAFYNDGGLPWGGVFIWFDYRNNANGDLFFAIRNN